MNGRRARWSIAAAVAAAAWLAGCAAIAPIGPGAALVEVERALGAPAMRWQNADGSGRVAFTTGPAGVSTYMVDYRVDQTVERIDNVLTESHFAAIVADMTWDEVLRRIGPPEARWTRHFPARDELAWEWRYCDAWRAGARFHVLLDNTTRRVRSAFSLRENCRQSHCPC